MKINTLPKIGIRPVIDGRRMGVRARSFYRSILFDYTTATWW